MNEIFAAIGAGLVSGVVSSIVMKVDVAWLKRGLAELRGRFDGHLEQHAEGKFR